MIEVWKKWLHKTDSEMDNVVRPGKCLPFALQA